jgi:murein DD-endopeptidase MepM/ murein hydrolase activator NlpD
MCPLAGMGSPRLPARVTIMALLALGAAGCSSDVSRFHDDPFSNPYASHKGPAREVTGSFSPPPTPAAPVQAQALPAPAAPAVAAAPPAPAYAPAQAQPAVAPVLRTAAAAPAPIRIGHGPKGAPAPAGGMHVVAPGESLSSVARLYGKSRFVLAKANSIPPDAKVRIGQRLTVPGARPELAKSTVATAAAPAAPPRPAVAAAAPPRAAAPPAAPRAPASPPPAAAAEAAPAAKPPTAAPPPAKVAVAPAATANVVTPAEDPAADEPVGARPIEATGGASFRWPVRGRIITAFGPKAAGQQNDGINLAVPEGTSVKAAEDGIVTYAGNELKGYGNLVLVRHNNGFVTAYAHASELMVKRGDSVKRGQIIARAGQTGNVQSPQLHFEIRKGATPVDPTQYLSGT